MRRGGKSAKWLLGKMSCKSQINWIIPEELKKE
jgi:hypothetical protein